MGSFNTTCFASGQTIAPGDRAVILPIIQAAGYEPVEMTYDGKTHSLYGIACMTCYPHAFWEPFGGFIEATYDDYGNFNEADTPANRARMLEFIDDMVQKSAVVKQGENQYHDIPFVMAEYIADQKPLLHDIPFVMAEYIADQKPLLHAGLQGGRAALLAKHADSKEFFNELLGAWGHAWEAAQEHRLFAVNLYDVLRPVQYAVMHGEAFDRLKTMYGGRKGNILADALAAAKEKQDALRQVLAGADVEPREGSQAQLLEHLRYMRNMLFMRVFERLGQYEGMQFPGEACAIEALLDAHAAGKLDDAGLLTALEPMRDARCVMNALGRLNLRISPQVYAGQDYSNEIGAEYAAFVQATSEAVTKACRARFGDDEDEE